MEHIYDNKLLRFIKFAPAFIIGLATMAIIGLMYYENRIEVEESLATLRADYIHQQKTRVKQEVDSVYQQLEYEKKLTEKKLKEQIKHRVDEAYAVMNSVYNNNRDKSDEEVSKLITDVLRDVRFNDGRGYYFIYKMNGDNVLLPHLTKFEGTPRLNMQDSRGSYIIQELTQIIKDHGKGYHRWWFYKPQDLENDLEKIGYVTYFEPLDWMIGTGEYVKDFEKDVQNRLLDWISEIKFSDTGYVFVIDNDATILAHQDETMRNFPGFNLHDSNKNFYIRQLINTARDGGGYVNYQAPYKPVSVTNSDKTSYVRWFEQWQWAIGAGVYTSEMEAYLAGREVAIIKQSDAELAKLMMFSFLIASVMFVLSMYLSGRLSTRYRKYQAKINHDYSELTKSQSQQETPQQHQDPLTDLPNRIQFNHLVRKNILDAEVTGRLVAVALVDVDNFRQINELYGHNLGDKLLTILGQRFEAILDNDDAVCRLGGDEFIFCFPNLVKKQELTDKLEIIQKVFSEKFVIDGNELEITATIGVVTYPDGGMIAEELMSNANIALYLAKNTLRGGIRYFSAVDTRLIEQKIIVQQDLD